MHIFFVRLQGKQDRFSVQVDKHWSIDRCAIVRISKTSMQTPTKTPPPPFKVKAPPDFVDYTELVPSITPTFATVLQTYNMTKQSLQLYNPYLLQTNIDWDTQRPDGVLYLKDGARKRHLATHKVNWNICFM